MGTVSATRRRLLSCRRRPTHTLHLLFSTTPHPIKSSNQSHIEGGSIDTLAWRHTRRSATSSESRPAVSALCPADPPFRRLLHPKFRGPLFKVDLYISTAALVGQGARWCPAVPLAAGRLAREALLKTTVQKTNEQVDGSWANIFHVVAVQLPHFKHRRTYFACCLPSGRSRGGGRRVGGGRAGSTLQAIARPGPLLCIWRPL